MSKTWLKKIFIVIFLAFLCATAFQIRLNNFKNSKARTIDEVVYVRLALQINQGGLQHYTSIPYARELAAQGRDLPDYFFRPVFKHPPLFTMLIAQSFQLFGGSENAAAYIPILFSVLMIPLIYILGKIVFNEWIGLVAAIILYFDPINIICSQKIWMESTLSFFVLFSVVLFAYAVKSNKGIYFILAGIICGFAALTKYPGLLTLFAFVLYALAFKRSLLKNPYFLVSLIMPPLVLTPWLIHVTSLSKAPLMYSLIRVHYKTPVFDQVPFFGILGFFFLIFLFWIFVIKDKAAEIARWPVDQDRFKQRFLILMMVIFGLATMKQFLHAWQITYLPFTTWQSGSFSGEPFSFYFGRLMEFGTIYVFAFMSFFWDGKNKNDLTGILRINIFIIMIFYIIWRNYQSRYILAVLPFLILLGVDMIFRMYLRINQMQSPLCRMTSKASLILIGCLILMKSQYINAHLSFTNDLCYF